MKSLFYCMSQSVRPYRSLPYIDYESHYTIQFVTYSFQWVSYTKRFSINVNVSSHDKHRDINIARELV